MLTVSDVSLRFSDRKLFDDVNIKFTEGNTYGLIGANGAGKSPIIQIFICQFFVNKVDNPFTIERGNISIVSIKKLSVFLLKKCYN